MPAIQLPIHVVLSCCVGRWTLLGSVLTIIMLTSGCTRTDGEAAKGPMPGGGAAPPPAVVDVQPVVIKTIRDFREYTGRTAASGSVELRARVSGYLRRSPRSERSGVPSAPPVSDAQPTAGSDSLRNNPNAPDATGGSGEALVYEGEYVKQGALLFQIDPEPYRLALEQASGSLKSAQSQLQRYEYDLARARDLLDSNSISRAEYDLAVANRAQAEGEIKSLEAALDRAQLDLEYTRVVSPIDGYLGRTLVTDGNLIVADTTILSTVVAAAPIYVYFNVDERSLLDYRERVRQGSVQSSRETAIQIQLGLANEVGYPHPGVIDFVNNTTDPNTGNTLLRATFANEDRSLSPGLFARIQAPFTAEYEAVMVPTQAMAMDQQGRYVFKVVEGKAVRQSIEPGETHGDLTVIRTGLSKDDMVVVSGLQKVRPGSEIATTPPPSSTAQVPAAKASPPEAPKKDTPTVAPESAGRDQGVQTAAKTRKAGDAP